MKTCKECRFFAEDKYDVGECRRHAPMPTPYLIWRKEAPTDENGFIANPDNTFVWPTIADAKEDWCGEFKEKR